jgi:hypothetical protein
MEHEAVEGTTLAAVESRSNHAGYVVGHLGVLGSGFPNTSGYDLFIVARVHIHTRQNLHDTEGHFNNFYSLTITRTQQWETGVLRVRLPRRLLPRRQDIQFLIYTSLDHTVNPIKREPGQIQGSAHEIIWVLPQPLKLEHRYTIKWSYPHGGSIYQIV